ncbi:sensor histidine kinase [Nocardioides aurantiacus]|uniref:sensor histidine kinase n=1 Tax=Nocardioides aurantiacus TaxID=86796 RepID=UPI0011CE7142|nr:ATP-binding protein [Nocardioides aurantiacus]
MPGREGPAGGPGARSPEASPDDSPDVPQGVPQGVSPDAEALRESTERYRALFFDNPHATFSLDPEGRFQDANAVTVELSGFSLEVLLTMRFDEILLAEALPDAVAAFEGALGRESQKLHTRIRSSAGEVMELNVALVPVVIDGEVVGLHGVAEDMTRENAMMRDLEEARRTAEEAASAKTMFLANMSHEVRTPLTSVLGATELLADGELDEEQRHLVDVVHRSGERLLLLVNDILDISRLEAGRLRLDPVELAVADIVEDLRAWAEPLAVRRGLRLRCEVAADLPPLVADPARLSQVLTNLVGNAVKFTEDGEIAILASPATAVLDEAGPAAPAVRFEVRDTGAGIPTDLLESLFEPFSQLDSSQTRRHGGAGLGLAICRELVDLMGGRLEASSSPGTGSSFRVLLPAG